MSTQEQKRTGKNRTAGKSNTGSSRRPGITGDNKATVFLPAAADVPEKHRKNAGYAW